MKLFEMTDGTERVAIGTFIYDVANDNLQFMFFEGAPIEEYTAVLRKFGFNFVCENAGISFKREL